MYTHQRRILSTFPYLTFCYMNNSRLFSHFNFPLLRTIHRMLGTLL